MDSIIISLTGSKPLYMQIYEHIRNSIIKGEYAKNEPLPSIRGLAKALSVSKITVEKAYDQLCSEGYIEGRERSRFYVAELSEPAWISPEIQIKHKKAAESGDDRTEYLYDFSSGEMDLEGFDFALWKKYMSRALSSTERLMKYGETRGEKELRAEIAKYLNRSRGVSVEPSQIIVGANTQVLIGQLCTLLDAEKDTIAFENPGFSNGRRVFTDHGFTVLPISTQDGGVNVEELKKSGAKAVYVSPSHQFPTGQIMPAPKRLSLLKWAAENGSYIIEDDYDSEFRYYGNPIPAMKGMDRQDYVIYVGSFSKIIPPSIRISYMILPEKLLKVYKSREAYYSQTASATEQLTLALFLADGQLDRQIRRLRNIYSEKRRQFNKTLGTVFGDKGEIYDTGSGLFVIFDARTDKTRLEIKEAAAERHIRVRFVGDYYMEKDRRENDKRLLLYFSSIKTADMHKALTLLKEAIES
ncbi:MAG: PLP-dependent aminotransferase family protein [Clostridiales bacterium]|jgi:GntR family transcriptional regulator/MocR family aminotransferase|nr:PLP-dependent aminotransferase family protein [Clostridiales bacterium]